MTQLQPGDLKMLIFNLNSPKSGCVVWLFLDDSSYYFFNTLTKSYRLTHEKMIVHDEKDVIR